MGMIACSDCGHQIGESALFCPNCGAAAGLAKAGKRFLRWGFKIALSVLGIMAVIGLIVFFFIRSQGG